MQVIRPSYEILTDISEGGVEELKHIELIGRACYKSEDKISDDISSAKKLIKGHFIKCGHESVLEHSTLCVKFIVDRGVSHELVRHRMASYSQESTRYCNYSKGKFGGEVTYILPYMFDSDSAGPTIYSGYDEWLHSVGVAESVYFGLLNDGYSPEQARCVLPNSLKTEIVVTANYREWRHILRLRCAKDAHPEIRRVMIPLCKELREKIPFIFDDVMVD
jgi:thymidylate synthase (FAD)